MEPVVRSPLIALHGLAKRYGRGQAEVRALDGIDLTINQGEFVAIMGPSGSGKSTLMNIIGYLDSPSEGSYLFDGVRGGRDYRASSARSCAGNSSASSSRAITSFSKAARSRMSSCR